MKRRRLLCRRRTLNNSAPTFYPCNRAGELPALDQEGRNLALAIYAAAGLLSPLYLPVVMVFSNADVTLVYSFLKDAVRGELPVILTMVRRSMLRNQPREHYYCWER